MPSQRRAGSPESERENYEESALDYVGVVDEVVDGGECEATEQEEPQESGEKGVVCQAVHYQMFKISNFLRKMWSRAVRCLKCDFFFLRFSSLGASLRGGGAPNILKRGALEGGAFPVSKLCLMHTHLR